MRRIDHPQGLSQENGQNHGPFHRLLPYNLDIKPNMTGLSEILDFKNLAKAGVAHGFCLPPAKAGGNSILLIGI